MPIASRLDTTRGCIFVVWSGPVTFEEWRSHFDALVSDPAFPPGRKWLVDVRRADVDLLDEAAIVQMGQRMNEAAGELGGIRIAVLPNGAWDKAATLLQDEVSIAGFTSIQFNDLGTACAWLGVTLADAALILAELVAELR